MLSLIRRMFCPRCFSWGTGSFCEECDLRTPVEKWAQKASQLSTPDQIIAARIVNGFTKDLEANWTLHKRLKDKEIGPRIALTSERDIWYKRWTKPGSKANYYLCNRVLENGTIFVAFQMNEYAYEEPSFNSFHVNEVPISDKDGRFIITSFLDLKDKIAEVKAAAAAAKKEMEDNEARWNLVESLFHMRRDGQGALVSIERWACEHGGTCSDEDCRPIGKDGECLLTTG